MSQLDPSQPHKAADDSEEVYFTGSPLLRAEIGTILVWWIGALVLLAVPFIWNAAAGEWPHWLVTVVAIILALLAIVFPVLLQRAVRYRISNYRIDYERGLLSKTIDTLELWHVDDIKFHQSLLDRILNTGTITIISNDDTTPVLVIRGVPAPRPLFDTLKQRVIAVKRQRGVIKMDVG